MAPRFVLISLAATFILLAAAGLLNYAVDPFQQYRVPGYEARFYRSFQRHENPGVARHYDYDRAIVASSFFENISGSELDRAFGYGRTMSLCESAMSAYDARKLMEVALEQVKVKEVLYGVDYSAFAGAPGRPGYGDKLPLYMYDDTLWNDYPYIFSLVTLRKSLDIVMHRNEEGYRTDRDAPWYWAHGAVFSARNVVDQVDPGNINLRYQQPQRTLEGMMASFEANVVPVVRDNPGTRFIFVWPPYSVIAWIDYVQRDQLEVSLEFRRRFVQALSKYPNVRMYDFQERTDWIDDLDQYRDIYHFSPKISSQLVKDMGADRERLTPQNVEARNVELRRIAGTADLGGIIAGVRAKR
jgi:hypothetical protein